MNNIMKAAFITQMKKHGSVDQGAGIVKSLLTIFRNCSECY